MTAKVTKHVAYSQTLVDRARKLSLSRDADNEEVYKLLSKALELGNAEAAYAIATWYLHGIYFQKHIANAITLLKKAAAQKYPSALFDLAVSYEKGIGVKLNVKKAFYLYLDAAIRGNKQSTYEVGRCYYYGIGIARNKESASLWLSRARELGVKEDKRDKKTCSG
jgi:TPR repeat protein